VARIEELAVQISEARTLRQQAEKQAKALWAQSAADLLGKLAQAHPARALAELISLRGGGTPAKSHPLYWDGTIPWITPKDMKVREIRDAIDHISTAATEDSAAKVIDPGAVLVVVRGMILVHTFPSAVLRVPAAINQDMKALVPKQALDPEFLSALLRAYNSQIVDLVDRSTHDTRRLETRKLLEMRIPLPPRDEQRRIVAELDALQAEVDTLRCLQTETAGELEGLLPAILDCVFDGGVEAFGSDVLHHSVSGIETGRRRGKP
jgi:type I restriction enzyme S subunit